MEVVHISNWSLFFGLFFILASGILSILIHLKIGKLLTIATIRMCVQLILMGYILVYIFRLANWWSMLGIFVIMVGFAAHQAKGHLAKVAISAYGMTFISMFTGGIIITYIFVALLLNVKPWYTPQYFIPLAGMILGNTTDSVGLAYERLVSEFNHNQNRIEQSLAMGATPWEASHPSIVYAIKSGTIPIINNMMVIGIVFLPGMMTGQILAGADPMLATRYQILIMSALVAARLFILSVVITWLYKKFFNADMQLQKHLFNSHQ